ncbi:phage late control D family protein [Cereibacter sphaeroides]|uniref:phage late control D family protein n=1 Tax=Cereibacter sphaeroides TaxID=1063 RepID=UPI000F5349A1|nr:contractile injection system protein, VgrG/Pvc8 family [Cereibacter sphaeroides]AZB68227.1 late control protein D [Cereibacter sphaeroides]
MGLTTWKPAFRVTVNGSNATQLFLPRVSSITISDTAGVQSDSCEIVLTDHIPMMPIQIPPAGAEIEIALGYLFAAQVVGSYVVDEIEVSGPPGQMRITGYGAAFGSSDGGKNPLTEAKTRSWPDQTTVKAMVDKIAGDSGFKSVVSAEAAKVKLPHIDQIDESDANLLTRVAREYGLIFKPAGLSLVMCKPGESTSASGQPLPTVALTPKQVTRWSVRISRREAAGKVVAAYRNFGSSEPIEIEVDGAPEGVAGSAQTKRLRKIYPNEAAARQAAEAEAARGKRKAVTLTLQLPGRADLMAEGRVALAGFRQGVDGVWLITRVQHSVSSAGWSSIVEAETPPK